jgi:hypothetical protein
MTKKMMKNKKNSPKFQLHSSVPTYANLKPIKPPEKVKIIKYREKVG